MLLNSPHNPTGRVLDRAELEAVAAVCREHDLIAVCDEVYEHLVFEGEHVPLATLPGMAERTLTISSIGKTFSFTGWKIGWACGPAELVGAVRGAKQFMTFAGGTPLQHAAAVALAIAEEHGARLAAELAAKRDRICAGLERAGFEVLRPAGTYFVNADVRPLGADDAVAFCRELPTVPASSGSRRRCSAATPSASARSCASRSASARRSSTRPRSGSPRCAERRRDAGREPDMLLMTTSTWSRASSPARSSRASGSRTC